MAPIHSLRRSFSRLHRLSLARLTLVATVSLCVSSLLIFYVLPASKWKYTVGLLDDVWPTTRRMPLAKPLAPLPDRVACFGPRGRILSHSPDDELRSVKLDIPYPTPFVGSYRDVGIDQTWMTADGRYGPYGFGEEDEKTYNRTRVDWDGVDWAKLQNECFDRNVRRFPASARRITNEQRFRLRNESIVPELRSWDEFTPTRRTAVVVRAYDGYEYTPEDMYNLRSLVVEAGLRTGGEYAVILLVHIRDEDSNIFESKEKYRVAFENAQIPPEFHSIAVLWDEAFLKSWYPKVGEYKTEYQVFQPLQLFALHYPEFDHYWQLELDMRILGDTGRYLDSLSRFARAEPRKQALERSSFLYLPSKFDSYASFSSAVDAANNGGAHVWGPLRIPDVSPIGPVPPVGSPHGDSFEWGRGEEADVIVTSYCADVLAPTVDWVYKEWIQGFSTGPDSTPRFFCPPAIMRGSRALLLAVHDAQLRRGLRIPSEATLPTFALWHGLKLSYPPQPVFMREQGEEADQLVEEWFRGGPAESSTGLGPDDLTHPRGEGLTWWWESLWPREVLDVWFGNGMAEEPGEVPHILAVKDGELYIPVVAMHPVKTQGR